MSTKALTGVRLMMVSESIEKLDMLVFMLQGEPHIHVVSLIKNVHNVRDHIVRFNPDLVAIDSALIGIDSAQLIRELMQRYPVPIVALVEDKENKAALTMLGAGALAVAVFPSTRQSPLFKNLARELIQTIKLMAEVKVVRRSIQKEFTKVPGLPTLKRQSMARLVVIGASTGGPPVLNLILKNLKPGFQVPIVIVQHIAKGFTDGLVRWLNHNSIIPVRLAQHGELIRQGYAYVAPEDAHLLIGRGDQLLLNNDPPVEGHCPAINLTMQSAAHHYGSNALGVLLSGMGKDGAQGLLALHQKGGVTIAQDAISSAVNGMPAAAIELDAADYVLAPQEITDTINAWAKVNAQEFQEAGDAN